MVEHPMVSCVVCYEIGIVAGPDYILAALHNQRESVFHCRFALFVDVGAEQVFGAGYHLSLIHI